ncbi:helix-turn-helix domain-containing protein [Vreelandella aquamarina]
MPTADPDTTISNFCPQGCRQIAQQLGIHSSTVSRELRRNSGLRDMSPHWRSVIAIRDAVAPGSGQSDFLAS